MKNINKIISQDIDQLNLLHSYQDACSNEKFRKYVEKLPIEEEVLIKYTSSLEDAYQEYENCKKCKSLACCKNKIEGYCYTPKKDKKIINFSYIACKWNQIAMQENAYKENLELFDMPIEIKEASLKNVYTDDKSRIPIIKYFKEFINKYQAKENPKGLYLTGSFGSGKTYLIAALLNEMAKKNTQCALVYYPEFLRNLKSSFQTDYKEKFDFIKKTPILLLDDIGAENESNWSRDEVLGPILQYRMQNHLATFFTSNLTLEELETSLATTASGVDKVKARRIIERIKQLTTTMELIAKNRRN
ncbi:MAG TPA: primosomal protein DnaI [Candidatus Faecimonas gallistercoris]|nr:primosomal protein DnaI [Candidatus Faecimonas gallistercoris]